MAKEKYDATKHMLVPEHKKMSEKDKKELINKYEIHLGDLPKINSKDPAIVKLDCKQGDIVRISRTSLTAGKSTFYRRVWNE